MSLLYEINAKKQQNMNLVMTTVIVFVTSVR